MSRATAFLATKCLPSLPWGIMKQDSQHLSVLSERETITNIPTMLNTDEDIDLTTHRVSQKYLIHFRNHRNVNVFKSFNTYGSYYTSLKAFHDLRTAKAVKNKKKVVHKMCEGLTFSVQERTDCVTWYTESTSVTWTRRSYSRTRQESSPFHSSILESIQTICKYGIVEFRSRPGRPSMTFWDERRISN